MEKTRAYNTGWVNERKFYPSRNTMEGNLGVKRSVD